MFKLARQVVRGLGERTARLLSRDLAMRADLTRGMGFGLGGLSSLGAREAGIGAVYDAGRVTRRDPDFLPQGLGPNAMADMGLDLAMRRCRDLIDNNPLIDGAVDSRVNAIIGNGITWSADTRWADLNERLDELFEVAVQRVDPEGCRSMAEDQRLFCREIESVGEVLVYRPYAEPFGRFKGGVASELIARERIPLDVNGVMPDGNEVRQGVEYDSKGRVAAYHVLKAHPRDGGVWGLGAWMSAAYTLGSPNLVRIPSDRCELAFIDRRIEQLRGVPRLVTLTNTVRMEDGYQDDAMTGARLQTAYAVVMEVDGNLSQYMSKRDQKLMNGQEPAALDANMRPVQRIEPGALVFVKKGANPKGLQPTLPGQQFEMVESVMQRRIARGLGLPYSTFSGDLSKGNFSSDRMGELTARGDYRPRMRFVWDHHTDPWRREKIAEFVLTGKLKLTAEQRTEIQRHEEQLYRVRIGFRGFEYVNPSQEATANATDINTGVRSEIEAIQEKGGDYRRVARELAVWEKTVREERIKLGLPPERPKQGISGGAAPTNEGKEDQNRDGEGADEDGAKNERLVRLGLNGGVNGVHYA